MEEISKELEREIGRSKPTSFKKKRNPKILILDDFGEIKSGGYLKFLVYLFSFTSILSFLAAWGLYFLFSDLTQKNQDLEKEVARLDQKVGVFRQEKEVLMARLVISGKQGPQETEISPTRVQTETGALGDPGADPGQEGRDLDEPGLQTIAVEKFAVTRKGAKGDLLVRFDIRNLSDRPGGISGRIFTILKPENRPQEEWLVVPKSALKNGVPLEYEKGQYFSIAHFKPMKFKIETSAESDTYKNAVIYVFNDNGELMFESLIDITEKETS